MSPLTQGRGLKLLVLRLMTRTEVAPYAGAWIEIASITLIIICSRRPLRRGVD